MNGPLVAGVLVAFAMLFMLNIGFMGRRDYSWPITIGSFLVWFLPLWYLGGYAIGAHPFLTTMALLFVVGWIGFRMSLDWMQRTSDEPNSANAPGREIRNRDRG